MRFLVSVLVCVGLLVALAGCDPTDKHYFTRGVGTELYPDDVANQTELQNDYVADICRQAGLVPTSFDGTMSCGSDPYSPATWWLFVQAGMNDIDRRCDDYLTWLDNVKRSRVPILNQIANTGTTTGNILLAAGVHSVPITIVGNAFGLAHDTFTNIGDRLILQLPHSTVQAVVLSRQKQYREQLIGDAKNKPHVLIASRPAAIFALRQYLRLCMPMTIETEVNNTVTVDARGGPQALMRSEPMISAQSVGAPIIKSTQPPPKAPKVRKAILGAVGPIEPHIGLERGKGFQRTLCVKDTGDFGEAGLPEDQAPPTRAQLREFNAAFRYGVNVPIDQLLSTTPDTVATPKNLTNLERAHRTYPSCQNAGLKNGFEVGVFTRYSVPEVKKQVLDALTAKKIAVPAKFDVKTSAVDAPLREAIAELRKKFDGGAAELDPKFYDWLTRASDRN